MKVISTLCALSCATLMAACAVTPRTGLRADEVRHASGEPALAVKLPEGERWFYPGGAFGAPSYAVDFNAAGNSTQVRIALNDDVAGAIAIGETAEAVLARIGPPFRKIRFNNLQQTAWDYRYRDTWGYLLEFSVMLDDRERVAAKFSQRLEPADRNDK
jgi:hypothetical protein